MISIKTKIKFKGKTGKAALDAVRKRFSDLPRKSANKLPSSFFPIMANTIRRDFQKNYVAMRDWVFPIFTRNYADRKDEFFTRGDSFDIGGFGVRPMKFNSAVFGRRTNTIYQALGGREGSFVSSEVRFKGKREANLFLRTGLNSAKWEGGNTQIRGDTGKVWNQTVDNQLLAFSDRVTPGGSRNSIFVQLSPTQTRSLAQFIEKKYRVAIRKVFQRAA